MHRTALAKTLLATLCLATALQSAAPALAMPEPAVAQTAARKGFFRRHGLKMLAGLGIAAGAYSFSDHWSDTKKIIHALTGGGDVAIHSTFTDRVRYILPDGSVPEDVNHPDVIEIPERLAGHPAGPYYMQIDAIAQGHPGACNSLGPLFHIGSLLFGGETRENMLNSIEFRQAWEETAVQYSALLKATKDKIGDEPITEVVAGINQSAYWGVGRGLFVMTRWASDEHHFRLIDALVKESHPKLVAALSEVTLGNGYPGPMHFIYGLGSEIDAGQLAAGFVQPPDDPFIAGAEKRFDGIDHRVQFMLNEHTPLEISSHQNLLPPGFNGCIGDTAEADAK